MKLSFLSASHFLASSIGMFSSVAAEVGDDDRIFVQGARLVGGTNGIVFDADNNLHACQSLGRAITKIDPESGEILDVIGEEEGALFPDDAVFAGDGTIYWSEFQLGTLFRRPPGGPTEMIYPFGSYPNLNPLVISDDGMRLFFGQCFNFESLNGIYQYDLVTGETTTVIDGIPACSSNSMDFKDEVLYTPRLFENRVVKIDLANNNAVSDVSTGLGIPNAVKFNSEGILHGTDSAVGKIYRYDIENPDTDNNRELVATTPFLAIDNLNFDKDDRLYVSSVNRGAILEVLGEDEFRIASPGILALGSGVAIYNDIVYTVNPNGVYMYEIETGEEAEIYEPVIGTGGLETPFGIVTWEAKERMLLTSVASGALVLWDPVTKVAEREAFFALPVDVHPFQGGDLIVTELLGEGSILLVNGETFETREVIATIPGAFFLGGDDKNVFASNFFTGTIFQIVGNGKILETPQVIAEGLNAPEGIALSDDATTLLVVASGSGTLEAVDIESGDVSVVASDLKFQSPIPDVLPFGWTSDVTLDGDYAFVNGDGAAVLYRIKWRNEDSGEQDDDTSSEEEDNDMTSAADCEVAASIMKTMTVLGVVVLSVLAH